MLKSPPPHTHTHVYVAPSLVLKELVDHRGFKAFLLAYRHTYTHALLYCIPLLMPVFPVSRSLLFFNHSDLDVLVTLNELLFPLLCFLLLPTWGMRDEMSMEGEALW